MTDENQKTVLEARLSSLHSERRGKEMSDDFAYTNGSLRRIDAQIRDVQQQLTALSGPSCQTHQSTEAT